MIDTCLAQPTIDLKSAIVQVKAGQAPSGAWKHQCADVPVIRPDSQASQQAQCRRLRDEQVLVVGEVASAVRRDGHAHRQAGYHQIEQHLQFALVEGDFLQRLGAGVLYGYRVGFGVYSGEGTALSEVDTTAAARVATVIYGYHELEFAFSDFVHGMSRVQVGVYGGGLVLGAQLRLRVGDERRTNAVVGGDLLSEVGQRAFFTLNTRQPGYRDAGSGIYAYQAGEHTDLFQTLGRRPQPPVANDGIEESNP
jgi:hypothetical protein